MVRADSVLRQLRSFRSTWSQIEIDNMLHTAYSKAQQSKNPKSGNRDITLPCALEWQAMWSTAPRSVSGWCAKVKFNRCRQLFVLHLAHIVGMTLSVATHLHDKGDARCPRHPFGASSGQYRMRFSSSAVNFAIGIRHC
eukprot:COSAG02_NODE_8889_length_2406_cov_10.267864_3_plen_138_part_01